MTAQRGQPPQAPAIAASSSSSSDGPPEEVIASDGGHSETGDQPPLPMDYSSPPLPADDEAPLPPQEGMVDGPAPELGLAGSGFGGSASSSSAPTGEEGFAAAAVG